ncbi:MULTISPECIES: phosphotransferase [Mycobacterium]|uniref:Aminoglycoside phosphotransferase n=1 Tax=Mycobacterium gordonae TaxID=1778 RepID=A0A1A6BI73_MYCGO|nr:MULTISPECIES: phosphotransferase [Mycobacterium]MCV7005201.1 phosphotransferase [Mycobacterium gordonae]OBS02028.1 hypothetical protein A9W98_17060 [Mycobacterium gordonae]ODR21498.1 hypothetical protein BHQ23_12255 [Mycobacterium gordonae]ORV94352.1 hypothetical protein AWC08_16865 [Mycobacterium gordonae]PJE11263.1 MAG: aminoglycoside phosphotransferase [Mycobacterium sp.]
MNHPTTWLAIPRSVEEIDAAWLSEAMHAAGTLEPAAMVRDVRPQRIAVDTGFSSEVYRLHLRGDSRTPATVIAKLPTNTAVREAMDVVGGYVRELTFYRDLALEAPIRAPRVHAAAMAHDSTDFILVLEDLAGWENESHYRGMPFARAQATLAELARLHAWRPKPAVAQRILETFPSLGDSASRQVLPPLFAEGWAIYEANARTTIPAVVGDFATNLATRIGPLLDVLTQRSTLIHGDIRADNLFFRGPEIGVVDYQLAARASGLADVGYLVSQGLTTEERSGRDEELVTEYLRALTDAGGAECAWADAWRQYRSAVAFYLIAPVIAMRGWDLLPLDARELCLRLVERAIATIEDIDALGDLS